ncbi:aminoglycoside adenylyltransferase domain-containing protein [Paenibacillus harenae]|uniref:Spectinomycin 9-adenylyltransferase n=1 Tax=Paenibacillus harenae TaxID=306543 RepID=A0ABT9U4K2_PAEHA|nr:aminoglycoside adenylyltransferase domain-containing protein [Paenibacillus harenae]MDQ0113918.1 streptomycin 3'-adenylyltransferase [Paenibacillus harenae]
MSGYDWNNCPDDVKAQTAAMSEYLAATLGENLVGIYVHGSMCLGCFQPAHSDLDVLVVTRLTLDKVTRFELMKGFLSLHSKPIPIEMSIISYGDIHPWKHPTPYQFHFSEYWRERYEQMVAANDMSFWDFKEPATDGDLACHMTLTSQQGICLYGQPIEEAFPIVPEADFWDSIYWGIDYFDDLKDDQLVTGLLTLIRIWSYKETKVILSKSQAGEWSLDSLPAAYHSIVQNAVDVYKAASEAIPYNRIDLEELKRYVINEIRS